jgi:hypothetical protein
MGLFNRCPVFGKHRWRRSGEARLSMFGVFREVEFVCDCGARKWMSE